MDDVLKSNIPSTPIENVALVAPNVIPNATEPQTVVVARKAPTSNATKGCKTAVPSEDQVLVRAMVVAAFPDAPVMVHVADAESDFCSHADNPKSTAYGVFQILEGTWSGYRCTGVRGDAADNIRCARKIYDARGTKDWEASRHKWGV